MAITAAKALADALDKIERVGWVRNTSAKVKDDLDPAVRGEAYKEIGANVEALLPEECLSGYCMIGAVYAAIWPEYGRPETGNFDAEGTKVYQDAMEYLFGCIGGHVDGHREELLALDGVREVVLEYSRRSVPAFNDSVARSFEEDVKPVMECAIAKATEAEAVMAS